MTCGSIPRAGVPWLVLVDFDGTLTATDGDFLVADALLGPERQGAYRPLAEAYDRLEISLAEYFAGYLALLGLDDPRPAIARVAATIQLRPGAAELLAWCRREGLMLRIASEGLDVYLQPALAAAGLGDVEVSCNRLVVEQGRCRVVPADGAEPCGRCLSCKGSIVRRAHAEGLRVAIVGDGASDLCAARQAELVLARGSLQAHCRREGIPFLPWETLEEVGALLRRYLEK
ncbi:MAG: HAD-IB family phosphatase [Deltaproteobacteria bacterium]|nr:HAD-IB family phosphatase [Deltaproteobacteria bacterium]